MTHSQVSGSIAEECRLLSSSAKRESRAIFIGFHSAAAIVEDLTGCGGSTLGASLPPRVKSAYLRFCARVAAAESASPKYAREALDFSRVVFCPNYRRQEERRFQATENHAISKRVVQDTIEMRARICLEDLTGIRGRTTVPKAVRRDRSG